MLRLSSARTRFLNDANAINCTFHSRTGSVDCVVSFDVLPRLNGKYMDEETAWLLVQRDHMDTLVKVIEAKMDSAIKQPIEISCVDIADD